MTESKHTQSIRGAGQVEQAFNLQHATTGNISTEFRNVENQRVCVTLAVRLFLCFEQNQNVLVSPPQTSARQRPVSSSG